MYECNTYRAIKRENVIVTELLKERSSHRLNIYPREWQRYLSKNEDRQNFQIDLGIEIVNYGISLDWKNLVPNGLVLITNHVDVSVVSR